MGDTNKFTERAGGIPPPANCNDSPLHPIQKELEDLLRESGLTRDQYSLAGSYHDGCTIATLRLLIGNADELNRLNRYRNTHWTQAELDAVLRKAIAWREEGGQSMNITVHRGSESVQLELPKTERQVSVRGFLIPCDMLGVVRLDVGDTTQGCVPNLEPEKK